MKVMEEIKLLLVSSDWDEKDIPTTKQEQIALCYSFLLMYSKLP